jgi:hypothetical protein
MLAGRSRAETLGGGDQAHSGWGTAMTIERNRGGFRLLTPLVFALLGASPGNSAVAGSGTIDPGNFAPGQDVSSATPGVVLSTLTLTPITAPNMFSAVLSPVYSDGSVFSPSLTVNSWGTAGQLLSLLSNCLNGCYGAPNLAGSTYLEVSFATPVSTVSVTEYIDQNNPAGFQAFNSAGSLIGSCYQFAAPSCYTALGTQLGNGEPGGILTVTDPGAISYILATSYDYAPVEIGEITYVPLPDTFWMLLVGLGGLGCCLLRRRVAIAMGNFTSRRACARTG